MKRSGSMIMLLLTCSLLFAHRKPLVDVDKQFELVRTQYMGMLEHHQDRSRFPQSTHPDGTPDDRGADWWCSGFFPGALWYIYEATGDTAFGSAADKWTRSLEKEKNNRSTHDLGFMLYCSYGNGYRLTKNKDYIEPLLTGARSLASRFDPRYGLIKSWDHHENCDYPVIIDNMMNLEYLLWAAKRSHERSFYKIALSHADNTMKNHFRKDYSSYHVVCYLPGGVVFRKKTNQGASDTSAWARGQGWALYGFTMMYRETKEKRYLRQALGVANFIMDHPRMPQDKIPFWDFDAPGQLEVARDASAAAVYASALIELSTYTGESGRKYFLYAEQILQSLSSSEYTAKPGTNNFFILKHSVGNKPAGTEINTPIIYADYYYLEALIRYRKFYSRFF